MDQFVVIYEHRFGVDVYRVSAECAEDAEELAKRKLDFEAGESIDAFTFDYLTDLNNLDDVEVDNE